MTEKKATLKAEFLLDEAGKPRATAEGGRTHYEIRLFVDDAPETAFAVNYELYEDYFLPLRESVRKRQSFDEEITSYGDYEVRAEVRTREGRRVRLQRQLSEALRDGMSKAITPSVEGALKRIRGS